MLIIKAVKFLSFVFGILFVVQMFCIETKACSCANSNACQNNARADAIIVGKIKDVIIERGSAHHKVEIERRFSGLQEKTLVDIYSDFVTSCAYSMQIGETYLIYARVNNETGFISTGYCSGTKLLKDSKTEIDYLESLKDAPDGQGILKGEFLEYDLKHKFDVKPWKPKEIEKIIIESETGEKYETAIQPNGEYAFTNLKGGWYKVFVSVPDRLILSQELEDDYIFKDGFRIVERKIKVPGFGCEARNYYSSRINGIITGKVLDSDGNALSKIPVNIYRFDDADDMPEESYKVWSNDEGVYVAKGLPSGRYLIGFGIGHDLYMKSHFAGFLPTFFPDTTDRKKAVFLKLKNAEILQGRNLTLPPLLNKRKIIGTVVFEDGKPAINASIDAYARRSGVERGDLTGESRVNSDGSFEFDAYEKTKYTIKAFIEEKNDSGNTEIYFSSGCYSIEETGIPSSIKIVLKRGARNCITKDYE